ncbi:hypothetical protein [Clostridium tyrobutyricum]|uniref:hypothetical protein n=1 Tax=Clostridium tyrobutyricum TaxID=1519 RepID=UPI001C3DA108|nr:hypothetical protein [Clostridium tyrobutyricum]MBV4438233.1 hypothetical protein [Clostridium tyrobutyricum]
MKNLILNQIYSTRKNILLVIILLLFLDSSQLVFMLNDAKLNNVTASQLDFLIRIGGGIQQNFNLFQYIKWIIVICTLLLLVENINNTNKGLDLMLISRTDSRFKWWSSKIIALILLNIFYVVLFFGMQKLISMIFLPSTNIWSSYLKIYYLKFYNSSLAPKEFQIIILGILLTGFIAISTLFQTINLIFSSNEKVFIIAVIVFLISGVLYMNRSVPRVLSPLNYSSTMDILPNIQCYARSIFLNIILIIVNVTAGYLVVRKKSIL